MMKTIIHITGFCPINRRATRNDVSSRIGWVDGNASMAARSRPDCLWVTRPGECARGDAVCKI